MKRYSADLIHTRSVTFINKDGKLITYHEAVLLGLYGYKIIKTKGSVSPTFIGHKVDYVYADPTHIKIEGLTDRADPSLDEDGLPI